MRLIAVRVGAVEPMRFGTSVPKHGPIPGDSPGPGDAPLKLCHLAFSLGVLTVAPALPGQLPTSETRFPPQFFSTSALPDSPDTTPDGGAGGAFGQVEPSAYADRYLTRLSLGGSVSTLGTGGSLATNLPYRIDLRFVGNFFDFNWKMTKSGFYVVVNTELANTGVLADYYPWKSLRISPGFLYYNTDRIRGDVQAQPGATFTINNVNYASQDSNPVYGTGRLQLRGTGFMAMAGWGHYVSRSEKRWSYPFAAGVAFIDTPSATFSLQGNVCNAQGQDCQPAATFPEFQSNLAAQVATWNNDVRPFHVYPIVEGGVTYTFSYRR